MSKTLQYIISVFLLFILVQTGIGAGVSPRTQISRSVLGSCESAKDSIYMALGDSIARGYGLDNPEQNRYSAKLADMLSSDSACHEFNYARDGLKTAELIAQIRSGDIGELCQANLITISIGANDILSPSIDFLYQYYMYLYSESSSMTAEILQSEYLNLTERIEAAIGVFDEQLDTLIGTIREQCGSEAQIVFQTIYNPYANSDIHISAGDLSVSLAPLADFYIQRMNAKIVNGAPRLGYLPADIYTAFTTSDQVCVNHADDFSNLSGLDPHPTPAGHQVIAEEILKTLQNAVTLYPEATSQSTRPIVCKHLMRETG